MPASRGYAAPGKCRTSFADRYEFASKRFVSFRAAFSRRQDQYFYGIGPQSRYENESRYDMNRLDLGPSVEVGGWRLSALRLSAGVRRVDYGSGDSRRPLPASGDGQPETG